ncbi:fasciclin-3 isoform X1 [Harpegnathos saltator]|uniref:fasciclin-3 isoform X1 n=1 Tax=Harpegnathos saltator TaxID=610380 RepID=UPI000DBEDF4A|nr:fasciclin-3 isoform X1 [Harpegnathos saltator]
MCTEGAASRRKMMPTTTSAWACFLTVLCATTTVKALRSNLAISIEPYNETAVRAGDSLQIMCRAPREIRVCRVEIPGEGNAILLSPGQPAEDGIEYYGDGFDKGQCGVKIAKVKETHDGLFKCSVATTDSRQEITASLNIIVARAPTDINLVVKDFHTGGTSFVKGQKIIVSCKAPFGRPAANISIYLDNDLLEEDKSMLYNEYRNHMQQTDVKNVTRTLDWSDNGKMIRCVANHIALEKPLETSMLLNVEFPPQPQSTFERFGYVIGRRGTVNITVYANPKPNFTWRIGNMEILEGHADETNRLQTSTAFDIGNGGWSLILSINDVQKSDTEKEYTLEARNNLGSNVYHVVLSTSSEPAGPLSNLYGKLSEHMHALGFDLDAGSIIGIVVGVMVLVLIIFLVIFARATGRWCFAGRSSTRNLGESSDTESAGRYSRSEVDGSSSRGRRKPRINLSRLFGRNKDKISGADTDTMRTVVTLDDEKLQTAEPATQEGRTNPPTSEGGIVYAELDLTLQQQSAAPRRLNEDKTEYAEILYTKPEAEEAADK